MSHTIHVMMFDRAEQAEPAQAAVQKLAGRSGSTAMESLGVVRDRSGQVWLHDLHPLPAEPWCIDGKILRLIVGLIFKDDCYGVLWGIIMAELEVILTMLGFKHRQLDTIRARLRPGTSALFILAPDSDRPADGLAGVLAQYPGECFQIALDPPVEAFLRHILGDLHRANGSLTINGSITAAAVVQLMKHFGRGSSPT